MTVQILAILCGAYGVMNFLTSILSTLYNCNDCPPPEKKKPPTTKKPAKKKASKKD